METILTGIGNVPSGYVPTSTGAGNASWQAATKPLWLPSDIGIKVANFEPAVAGSTVIAIAGSIYLLKIMIRQSMVVSNVNFIVTGAGNNTNGSTGTFVALYSSNGAQISVSADVAASLTSSGLASLPLAGPVYLTAGTFVWVALVCNLGTTQPTFARAAGSIVTANAGATAASFWVAVNGTVQTALPTSITPASNTGTNALWFWAGIS